MLWKGERIMIVAVPDDVRKRVRGRAWGLLLLALAAVVRNPATAQVIFDPLERVNRASFTFNEYSDTNALEPTAKVYPYVAPVPVRRSVRNFLYNLREPVVFANDVLQGERERAGIALSRFMINSTLGVFGLFDAASTFGYTQHFEDLGQTLGVYGVPDGPYLMLPLLGPSNPRDLVGRFGDFYLDPVNQCCLDTGERLAVFGSTAVSEREVNIETADDLKTNSIDLYATVRTIYLQKRAADIRNGAPPTDQQGYEDIFKDEEDFE